MPHSRSTTNTVAILGADTLVEDILARLLKREGYHVRHLEAHPTGLVEDPLDGVDVLLVAPGLDDGVRETFLEAIMSTLKTAAIPVLTLSAALKLALLDELSAGISWSSLFEELVEQLRAALARAAESVESLIAEGPGAGPPPAPQADAL